MTQRAVIFDFGGVLVKTQDYAPRHRWDETLGMPHGTVESIVHGSRSWLQLMRGEIDHAEYWADVAARLNISDAAVAELMRDFYSGDRLDQELVHCIHTLRERGHQVALLSNATVALPAELMELGIYDLFDPLVISAHIGALKPEAEAYSTVLSRLGIPGEQAIFVDDVLANIEGAAALGIHGVHYIDGMDLPATLEPLLHAR